MKRSTIILLFACLLATLAAAQPQSITGVVTNGTTNQPAAGDDVILLKLGQGMQEEARTKTNAQGEFKFTASDLNTPHLIRVRHDNVNYHEPAMDPSKKLSITVYNALAKVPGVKLLEQSEVYQAKADQMQVIELFRVNNTAIPKVTQPTFEFYLPEGATIRAGQAMPASGMPVQSAPVPQQEKNKYAFLYPVRPGITQFELVFTMPYNGKATFEPKLTLAADHFYVVTAQGINFSAGAPLRAVDQWPTDPTVTGVNTHAADNVAPGQKLSFQLSGTGLLPEQQEAPSSADNRNGPQPRPENRPGGGLGAPNERPDPLHSSQWLFLGVLVLFLAAGATYVYSSNHGQSGDAAKKPQDRPAVLLEALKEEMFQLESDRLQGKLSVSEYESAKGALDKTLQRAMNRQTAP